MFTNSGKKKLNKGYKIVTFLLVALIGIETFSLCYHPLKVTNLLLFEDDQVLALNKPSGCASIESLLPPILENDYFSEEQALKILKEELKIKEREQNPLKKTPIYTVTDQEYNWLVKLVFLEAGYCSLETKISIISLVFNRLESEIWGDSLEKVLFATNQFRKKKTLEKCIPYSLPKNPYYEQTKKFINAWDDCYKAVDFVLEWGSILPSYVMFYRTDYHFKWKGYKGYSILDNLYFGYLQQHKE